MNIKEDTLYQSDTKDLIVDLIEEIKLLKDSIKFSEVSVVELKAFIDLNSPDIKEKISYFDAIEITINDLPPSSIDCIANCIFNGRTNCSKSCCHY